MKVNDSERLQYEIMTAGDSDLLFELDQDPEVMRYVGGGQINSRQDIDKVMIPRMQSYTNREKGWGVWKVSSKIDGCYLGWIIIRPADFFSDSPQFDNIEIGWRFFRKFWGNGYATEAAQQFKQAFMTCDEVIKLTAIAIEENVASVNIMKKLGMKFIKKDIHKDPLGDNEVVFYEMDI